MRESGIDKRARMGSTAAMRRRAWGLVLMVSGCTPAQAIAPELVLPGAIEATDSTLVEEPRFDLRFAAPAPAEAVPIRAVNQYRIFASLDEWRFDPRSEFVATKIGDECGVWEIASGVLATTVALGEASPCAIWVPALPERPSPRSADGLFEAVIVEQVGIEIREAGALRLAIPCPGCRWWAWSPRGHEVALTDGEHIEVWDLDSRRQTRQTSVQLHDEVANLLIGWTDEAIAMAAVTRADEPCVGPDSSQCLYECDWSENEDGEYGEDCEDASYTVHSLASVWWPFTEERPDVVYGLEPEDSEPYIVRADPRFAWLLWSDEPGERGGIVETLSVCSMAGNASGLSWIAYDSYDDEDDEDDDLEADPDVDPATRWSLANGFVLEVPAQAKALAPSPDRQRVASLAAGRVLIRERASGAAVVEFDVDPDARKVAWREDGAVVWTGVEFPTHAYDPRTGQLLGHLEFWTLDVFSTLDPSWRWILEGDGSVTRLLDFANLEVHATWARLDSGLFEGELDQLPDHRAYYDDFRLQRFSVDPGQIPCRSAAELEPYLRREGLAQAFFAGEPLALPSVPSSVAATLACPTIPLPQP